MKIKAGRIFAFLGLIVCTSCNNGSYNGSHLPPKVMQKVLLDITMAENYSSMIRDSLHKRNDKNVDSLAVFYKDIFAHYKITQEEFKESLKWYKNHPATLDSIYNNLLPVVTKWQEQKKSNSDKPSSP